MLLNCIVMVVVLPDGSSGDLWLYWLLVLIFFVFLCMPDSPTYHAHFVCKYLWDVNGIPSHVTSSSSLCAQWRVWSKNLPGGVSLTTSNRCRKICWQQAAWLSEGGNQHNRRRTTRGIFERRWPTLHQESSQPGMSLRCSEQRLHQRRSDPHCVREGWWSASMRFKLWCHCSWEVYQVPGNMCSFMFALSRP